MHRTRNPANQVFLGAQVQILYTPFCQYVEDQADAWSFFYFLNKCEIINNIPCQR